MIAEGGGRGNLKGKVVNTGSKWVMADWQE